MNQVGLHADRRHTILPGSWFQASGGCVRQVGEHRDRSRSRWRVGGQRRPLPLVPTVNTTLIWALTRCACRANRSTRRLSDLHSIKQGVDHWSGRPERRLGDRSPPRSCMTQRHSEDRSSSNPPRERVQRDQPLGGFSRSKREVLSGAGLGLWAAALCLSWRTVRGTTVRSAAPSITTSDPARRHAGITCAKLWKSPFREEVRMTDTGGLHD